MKHFHLVFSSWLCIFISVWNYACFDDQRKCIVWLIEVHCITFVYFNRNITMFERCLKVLHELSGIVFECQQMQIVHVFEHKWNEEWKRIYSIKFLRCSTIGPVQLKNLISMRIKTIFAAPSGVTFGNILQNISCLHMINDYWIFNWKCLFIHCV